MLRRAAILVGTTTILVLVLVLSSNPAVAVEPGVYYCVTEHMVGIQPEREATEDEDVSDIPRFSGQIMPEKNHFVVKIPSLSRTKPLWCKNVDQIDSAIMDQIVLCAKSVKWEAVLPDEKVTKFGVNKLLSRNALLFTANEGQTTFWITPNLNYQLAILDGIFGNYVEEGHCVIFKE